MNKGKLKKGFGLVSCKGKVFEGQHENRTGELGARAIMSDNPARDTAPVQSPSALDASSWQFWRVRTKWVLLTPVCTNRLFPGLAGPFKFPSSARVAGVKKLTTQKTWASHLVARWFGWFLVKPGKRPTTEPWRRLTWEEGCRPGRMRPMGSKL